MFAISKIQKNPSIKIASVLDVTKIGLNAESKLHVIKNYWKFLISWHRHTVDP